MDPGDADVDQPLDAIAGEPRGQRRLLRHRQIAGAGRDDQHRAAPDVGDRLLLDDESARQRLVPRRRHLRSTRLDLHLGHARGQHVAAGARQLADDVADLLGGLAEAEHHLGEAGAQVAMVIDVREAEIPEGQIGQLAQRVVDGSVALRAPARGAVEAASGP